jgi:hypothetical protein
MEVLQDIVSQYLKVTDQMEHARGKIDTVLCELSDDSTIFVLNRKVGELFTILSFPEAKKPRDVKQIMLEIFDLIHTITEKTSNQALRVLFLSNQVDALTRIIDSLIQTSLSPQSCCSSNTESLECNSPLQPKGDIFSNSTDAYHCPLPLDPDNEHLDSDDEINEIDCWHHPCAICNISFKSDDDNHEWNYDFTVWHSPHDSAACSDHTYRCHPTETTSDLNCVEENRNLGTEHNSPSVVTELWAMIKAMRSEAEELQKLHLLQVTSLRTEINQLRKSQKEYAISHSLYP